MKFKIDENLPVEAAEILRGFGFVADTVADEDLSGADDDTVARTIQADDRILVTLAWTSQTFGRTRLANTRGSSSYGSKIKINSLCCPLSGA